MDNVVILNNGPAEYAFDYAGETYPFPVGEPKTIPYMAAYHIFGIEAAPTGKLIRNKAETYKDAQGAVWQTQYQNRIASYSPYGLVHGKDKERDEEKFKEFRTWFDRGFDYKPLKTPKNMTLEQFKALK